ncbi:MAG: AraC family transcriptional regulator [Pseudomonadota bacterium]
MSNPYEDRIRRVLRYVHDNPGKDLSLDRLADVAAMSRFHWHRVFRAMTGETCAEAVRRIRLERAAFALVHDARSIEEIAASVGYDNIRSFNRAFRDHQGMTPAAFRRSGVPGRAALRLRNRTSTMYHIEIKYLPATRLASMPHKGAYPEIRKAFEKLETILSTGGLWPQTRGMAGVYFDDPNAVAIEELTSLAAVILPEGTDMPEGLTEHILPGGRHAVLMLEGPYTGLQAAYDHLYGAWFPNSGEEPGDAPSFEIYLNAPHNTPATELRTQICAPLKT